MITLAWAYAFTAAVGTAMGVSRRLPGALFGSRTGRSAGFDAAIGYGTGLSAPWTMVVALLLFAHRHQQRSMRWLAFALLFGQLGEPVTYRLDGKHHALERAVVTANLAIPTMIIVGSVTVSGR